MGQELISREALERIIKRAAELQASERDIGDGLTENELVALGKDVGIPSGYLRQALRNLFAILNVWRVLGPCRVAGLTLDDATGPRLAYAVPIAAGAVLALFRGHL